MPCQLPLVRGLASSLLDCLRLTRLRFWFAKFVFPLVLPLWVTQCVFEQLRILSRSCVTPEKRGTIFAVRSRFGSSRDTEVQAPVRVAIFVGEQNEAVGAIFRRHLYRNPATEGDVLKRMHLCFLDPARMKNHVANLLHVGTHPQ